MTMSAAAKRALSTTIRGLRTRLLADLAAATETAYRLAVRAQDAVGVDEAPTLLDEVLVSGEQPGPGLWKVIKTTPAGEHVMWVLGSYGPLPQKMQWRSAQVEQAIASYQQVLDLEPDNEDAAFNKALVEQLLKQQREQEQKTSHHRHLKFIDPHILNQPLPNRLHGS